MFVRETRSLQMNIKLFGLIFTLLTLNISYGCAQEVHTEGKSLNKLKSIFENVNKYVQCDEDGHQMITNTFSWADYLVLGAMLVISCGIGVFYGFFGGKHESSDDFLLGGSSMGTFPMAMSLAASFITAIELLGNPGEMYQHGTQYWMICLAFILVVPLTSKFFLPVYMKLRLTSTYEYLQLRFSPKTRYLASGLYILQMVLYTSVAVYAPALALSHETGLNVYMAVTVVYVVCIFYASQGGMKAVIMTDTFQAAVLVGSILLIVFFGEKFIGGAGIIWSQNYNTERLELFNMNPDPTERHTFWSVVIGGTFYWMTMFCSNQASIQKYLSVERISQVRSALWFSAIGLILIFTINFYTGMILVAHYSGCDPIKAGDISSSDEILPLYVISEMGHLKGVTGFFVAGIFAASLGTVASALNSLSAVTFQDFITGAMGIKLSASKSAFWAKAISILFGAISFALVFIVEQLGNVMQVALSFNGMVGGVTLGLFSLGMFFPWSNSKGAIFGATVAMAFVMWMGLGQQVAKANGLYTVEVKAASIDKCPCLNVTTVEEFDLIKENKEEEIFYLFRISYLWYSAIGFLVTVIVGLLTSFIVGAKDPKEVDEDLLSPPFRSFYAMLPKTVKILLKLPIIQPPAKDIKLNGVVNITLDVSDENIIVDKKAKEIETMTVSEKVEQKAKRKISAP